MNTRALHISFALMLSILFCATFVFAHEGHDHAIDKAIASNTPQMINPATSTPPATSVATTTATTTPYVMLTQIPYTGFDFGVLGNSLFWLGLVLVALMGAYLIMYSESGRYPRSLGRDVAQAARNQWRFVRRIVK